MCIRLLFLLLPVLPALAVCQPSRPVTKRTANGWMDSYLNPNQAPFYHGVASGDPLKDRVILWTRITPPSDMTTAIDYTWQVAADAAFDTVVQSGQGQALPAKDWCVKVDADGLLPGHWYWYRFQALGAVSLVGRTRTAPAQDMPRMRLGILSCSDYREGYFTALSELAERNDVDLVIHTGDYIYEGGGSGAGLDGREHYPFATIYRLDDYRSRLSQYHLDPDLQRCHQLYPWMVMWDDHDIVVDALRDTCLRHEAALYGSYHARKQAAVTAMREWLPLRDAHDSLYKSWRSATWGSMAEVILLDTRLYDRDSFATSVNSPVYGSPAHHLIGPEQMSWFLGKLQSPARWKVVGNQVMFSQFEAGDTPLIFENWDGYTAEQNQVMAALGPGGASNVVFTTGDFHCSFANNVAPNPYDTLLYTPATGAGSVAVELVAPSVCAGNFDEGADFGLPDAQTTTGIIHAICPHTKYVNLTEHGFILLDLTAERAQAEFWHMADTKNRYNREARLASAWRTLYNQNRLDTAATPVPVRTDVPPPPAAASNYTSLAPPAPGMAILTVYPNPAAADGVWLNYALNTTQPVHIQVYDVAGKLLHTLSEQPGVAPGNYLQWVPLPPAAAGLLTITLQAGAHRQTVRVMKL